MFWWVVGVLACGGPSTAAPAASAPVATSAAVPEVFDEAPPESVASPTKPVTPAANVPVTMPDHLPLPDEVTVTPKGLVNGQFAADFSGDSLSPSGGSFQFSSMVSPKGDGKKKAALVAFMASWCGYCRQSLPTLKDLLVENAGDLQIVILTTDETAAKQAVEAKAVADAGLDVPVLVATAAVRRAYMGDSMSLPHFYVINRLGEVLVQDRGFGDKVRPLMPRQILMALKDTDYTPR